MRALALALVLTLTAACGGPVTPAGEEILVADVQTDLEPDERKWLVGILEADPVTITFPDEEASVDVIVVAARRAKGSGASRSVDTSKPPTFVRSITVRAKDAAGYELTSELTGNPVNVGTEEEPIHSRTLKVRRHKKSLFGTSTAEMSIRATPSGVERL
jgi:hypothetical protein